MHSLHILLNEGESNLLSGNFRFSFTLKHTNTHIHAHTSRLALTELVKLVELITFDFST